MSPTGKLDTADRMEASGPNTVPESPDPTLKSVASGTSNSELSDGIHGSRNQPSVADGDHACGAAADDGDLGGLRTPCVLNHLPHDGEAGGEQVPHGLEERALVDVGPHGGCRHAGLGGLHVSPCWVEGPMNHCPDRE